MTSAKKGNSKKYTIEVRTTIKVALDIELCGLDCNFLLRFISANSNPSVTFKCNLFNRQLGRTNVRCSECLEACIRGDKILPGEEEEPMKIEFEHFYADSYHIFFDRLIPITKELIASINNIPGVESVGAYSKYNLHVGKGRLFPWEPIYENIKDILIDVNNREDQSE